MSFPHGSLVIKISMGAQSLQVAKDELDNPKYNCPIPYAYFKHFIMKYILKRWQDSWNQQIHNRLHEIHSLVSKATCSYGQNRKQHVIMNRCRIGYSRYDRLRSTSSF